MPAAVHHLPDSQVVSDALDLRPSVASAGKPFLRELLNLVSRVRCRRCNAGDIGLIGLHSRIQSCELRLVYSNKFQSTVFKASPKALISVSISASVVMNGGASCTVSPPYRT